MVPDCKLKEMHILPCSFDLIQYLYYKFHDPIAQFNDVDYSSPKRPKTETNHNIPLEVAWSVPEFAGDVACAEALDALGGADEVDIPLDALMVDPLESVATAPNTGVTLGKNWSAYWVRPVHVGNPLVWPLDHEV